jgi:hypothetical protein
LIHVYHACPQQNPEKRQAIRSDLMAVRNNDASCNSYIHALLHFKGERSQTHTGLPWSQIDERSRMDQRLAGGVLR